MLSSCQYCGRVHDSKARCPAKPPRIRIPLETKAAAIRRTHRWKDKSLEIRERDNFMCQVCWADQGRVNYDGISVHHIVPIAEDEDKVYDDDNLISLCAFHHELAEAGGIKKDALTELARARNKASSDAIGEDAAVW